MEKQDICGIYKIINTQNNKTYIGSSKNIFKRLRTHVRGLKNGTHPNKHLTHSFDKHGLKVFNYVILEECLEKDLVPIEQKYLDLLDFKVHYNMCTVANGGGGNLTAKPVLLIDLKGNIVKEFKSGLKLQKFVNRKCCLDYKSINTSSIIKRKYRIVTPYFFKSNIEVIKSWSIYASPTKHKIALRKERVKRRWYKVYKGEETHLFKSMQEIGDFLGITREAVRLNLKKSVKVHSKTGYMFDIVDIF